MKTDAESKERLEIRWPEPPPDWALAWSGTEARDNISPQVHVWAATLDLPAAALSACQETLSGTELARAARFRFQQHRNRFIAGRGLLRVILGRYLQIEPRAIEFAYGPQGKPFLAEPLPRPIVQSDDSSKPPRRSPASKAGAQAPEAPAPRALEFNLAHSQNLALLAVSASGPIGVDVELIRLMPDAGELVARFFSERETEACNTLPKAGRAAAFFNLWTRKEAWLKATGEGIGHSLNQVEVSFLPGEPARLIALPKGWQAAKEWKLSDLSPAPGFAGALAMAAPNPRLSCWKWSAEWMPK